MQDQRRHRTHPLALLATALLSGVTLTACEDATLPPAPDAAPTPDASASSGIDGAAARGLATMRRATARYHRVEAAVEDGFEQILPCLENPSGPGGLGIPYARLDRFDAVIDLSEPEILFYEPQADGRLRLVGGEPVTPIELWEAEHGSEPPSMFGRTFHRNEEHGLYGLHMWVWRHNPDGVFAFWNAEVSCDAGAAPEARVPGSDAVRP